MGTARTLLSSSAIAFVGLLGLGCDQASGERVGIVDKERVFSRSSVALMIRGQVAKPQRATLRSAERMLREAKKIERYLANNKHKLAEQERQKLSDHRNRAQAEVHRIQEQVENKVKQAIRERTAAYEVKFAEVLESIAQEQHLADVLLKTDSRVAEYARDSATFVDITDRVIKELVP